MTPGVVAHRGLAACYPENTLAAMQAALQAGACYLECDIQLSRDKVPMLHHDADLLRSTGQHGCLFDLDSHELEQISVHEPGRFGLRFTPLPMSRLSHLIKLLTDWPRVQLFVELKEESLQHFGIECCVEKVLEAIQPHAERCILISFDYQALYWLQKNHPQYRIGWVLPDWNQKLHTKAWDLAPQFLFSNIKRLPDSGPWPGPWQWAVYEITKAEHALQLGQQGIALVESFNVAELLRDPTLMRKACHV